jgi:hypothetical protein
MYRNLIKLSVVKGHYGTTLFVFWPIGVFLTKEYDVPYNYT